MVQAVMAIFQAGTADAFHFLNRNFRETRGSPPEASFETKLLKESEQPMSNTPIRNFRINTGFTRGSDNEVNNLSLDVMDALTGHPVFINPTVSPSAMLILQKAFSASMTDARKGGTDRTLAKNIAKQALVDALVSDALYCQGLARHDLNTLLTSGYEVASTNRTPGPLDTPSIITILNNVSGQLTVRGQNVLNGRIYQAQASTDGGKMWGNLGNFNGARLMLLKPTTPGATYIVQICALGGSTGQSAWSNPFTIMAT
jgi:hypothetical protein